MSATIALAIDPKPIPLKAPPSYAITSVDHALKLAAILQLEGGLTVSAAAERLGVARSTAHRMLQMLVYRDFAFQDAERTYRPGAVLGQASHLPSRIVTLRTAAVPHMKRLSWVLNESVNVSILSGETTRFIASVECERAAGVTTREGMAFPLHHTTTGMLHLASLPDTELLEYLQNHEELRRSDRKALLRDVAQVRRTGFALNVERSEAGLVAIGVPIAWVGSGIFAGISIVRRLTEHDPRELDRYVSALRAASAALSRDLRATASESPSDGIHK
jgi:DNA-binding IclR family transcriptional regulator